MSIYNSRLLKNKALSGSQMYNSAGRVELHDCYVERSEEDTADWQTGGVVVFCQDVGVLFSVLMWISVVCDSIYLCCCGLS